MAQVRDVKHVQKYTGVVRVYACNLQIIETLLNGEKFIRPRVKGNFKCEVLDVEKFRHGVLVTISAVYGPVRNANMADITRAFKEGIARLMDSVMSVGAEEAVGTIDFNVKSVTTEIIERAKPKIEFENVAELNQVRAKK